MLTSLTKKMLLAFALTTLVVGSAAFAGDVKAPSTVRKASQSGRPYTSYGSTQTTEMLDAINRDHPVATPNRALTPGYVSSQKERESTSVVDTINQGGSVHVTHNPMNPALSSYKDQTSGELFEALGDR